VIAVVVTLSFLTVNNLFLDIVSQQHDKHVAFDSSGWSSMRAYLSVRQLTQRGRSTSPAGCVQALRVTHPGHRDLRALTLLLPRHVLTLFQPAVDPTTATD